MNDSLVAKIRFTVSLWGLGVLLRIQARRYPAYREQLRREDLTAQVRLHDGSQGRYFTLRKGRVSSNRGIHPHPDVTMVFRDAAIAARIIRPKRDRLPDFNTAHDAVLSAGTARPTRIGHVRARSFPRPPEARPQAAVQSRSVCVSPGPPRP